MILKERRTLLENSHYLISVFTISYSSQDSMVGEEGESVENNRAQK